MNINDAKYIYFEVKRVSMDGTYIDEPRLMNVNILHIKPHTNSDGIWGYRNVDIRNIRAGRRVSYTDQYWVDLTKYVHEYGPTTVVRWFGHDGDNRDWFTEAMHIIKSYVESGNFDVEEPHPIKPLEI